MRRLYELITKCWSDFGKWIYSLNPDDEKSWNEIIAKANAICAEYVDIKKEQMLVRGILLLIIDYYEAEWRQAKEVK